VELLPGGWNEWGGVSGGVDFFLLLPLLLLILSLLRLLLCLFLLFLLSYFLLDKINNSGKRLL